MNIGFFYTNIVGTWYVFTSLLASEGVFIQRKKELCCWITLISPTIQQWSSKQSRWKFTEYKNCIVMPFVDTNSHLTTKPFSFDIPCQLNLIAMKCIFGQIWRVFSTTLTRHLTFCYLFFWVVTIIQNTGLKLNFYSGRHLHS